MDLQKEFDNNLVHSGLIQEENKVLVAVSTGVDSMVLLNLLLHSQLKLNVAVAYVNHHLRRQSVEETEFIKEYCESNHIPLYTADWMPSDHPKAGVEAASRKFRYSFFRRVLDETGIDILATAHHQNDLAESMLMKLVRGGRLSSLIGIAPVRNFHGYRLVRPLLSFKKEELIFYASNHYIHWYEDETNKERDVFRNRVRLDILPALVQENDQALAHFESYSNQLRQLLASQKELIDIVISQIKVPSKERFSFEIDKIQRYSEATQKLAIMELIGRYGETKSVTDSKLVQLIKLINNESKPQGRILLSKSTFLSKEYGIVSIKKADKIHEKINKKTTEDMLVLDRWNRLDGMLPFGIFTHIDNHDGYQCAKLLLTERDFPLAVRTINSGDKFAISETEHQKVSRLMIDRKVPNDQRELIRVLVSNQGTILAVLGYRVAYQRNRAGAKVYYLVNKNER
ncbi:tRNA lysidine(34) synthetase TilS [Lentilactobacillus sp. Marseille-Q4993]|uniref:tRNA lysidine(34) synthetase TilS n=1 Tax=Lentilactobacillus sp. Marseille-Q4993 TaxID=3039492 RepID=UPI0024BCB901|nr:tRNA lysidine(34) synthetase TilS [Lentilactobacillus sp. Marseille-Q4993]